MRITPVVFFAGLWLAGGVAAQSAVVFVNPAAAGPRTGASWNNGFATVGAAITAAKAGDEVWVKAGTYKELIILRNAISLYGGFAGTETTRAQRNPAANVTILDADRKGSVISANQEIEFIDPVTVVNGFTLRNGLGTIFYDNQSRASTAGGAVHIHGCSPEISGNVITANLVGGPLGRGAAIYIKGDNQARIVNNLIEGNGDLVVGEGTIFVEREAFECSPFIANNEIRNNLTHAVQSENATPVVANNLIHNNKGNGVYLRNPKALQAITTVTITGNTIVENRPRDESAAYEGYGISVTYQGTAKISNNIIAWNGAGGLSHQYGIVIEARNNCVYGNNYSNFESNLSSTPNPWTGNGNMVVNPGLASMPYDDYHIRHDSPCRNAGDPASAIDTPDMDGEARVQGGRVDIGYDESNGKTFDLGYNVVRVKPTGDDAVEGKTWASAKKTIQSAVTKAGLGGEVWVASGVYAEAVVAPQSQLVFGGYAGTETERGQRNFKANAVVIDGGKLGSTYAIKGGSTAIVVFDGFVVQNSGTGLMDRGSGFFIGRSPRADVTVRNVIARNNGYGISALGTGALVADCAAVQNSEEGIYFNSSGEAERTATIHNNFVHQNAGSGISVYFGSAVIANNQVTRNGSSTAEAGLNLDLGPANTADVINNTIAANTGFGAYLRSGSEIRLTNNIVAWNTYNGVWRFANMPVLLKYNCVYGNVGENFSNFDTNPTGSNGNVSVDPMFATVPYNDFHIRHNSPMREAGDNTAVPSGALDIDFQSRIQGAKVDIGADESNGAQFEPLLTIVRVKTDGNDGNDGSTWAKAKKTVQAGIDAALGGELWVASGTYAHTGGAQYSDFLTLRPNVPVYGGFTGVETGRDQRNFYVNETVLHGGNTGDVVIVESGITSPTVLDGFVITGSADFGTAVEVKANPVPELYIRNNVIFNCNDGLYVWGSSPVVYNNLVYYNTGDAIAIQSGANPQVLNNIVYANGEVGISLVDSGGRVANNLIAENSPGVDYRAALEVSADKPSLAPRIENNTIARNGGYGVNSTGSGSPVYVNNIIAWNGQGFRTADQSPTLRNNCLYGNRVYNTTGFAVSPIGTNGNVSVDPRFASAAYSDYRIRHDSPVRDKGDNTVVSSGDTDNDGEPRLFGALVDIGADESTGITFPGNYNTVHVSPGGDDANNGSSWAKAKKTLGSALAAGAGVEIWVAAGTYTNPSTEDYEPYIPVHAHQQVYGGFSGTETERDQRDFRANETILDGNTHGSSVVYFEGKATAPTVLDGFTIRRPSDYASGVKMDEDTQAVVRNNVIRESNTAISISAGTPRIENNTITGNEKGISASLSAPSIRNNLVVLNQGEGITLEGDGQAEVVNNTIAGNTPADWSGALYLGSESQARISNNIVAFNTSGVYGHGNTAAVLRYNNVHSNNGYDYQYLTDPTGTNGNMSADPLFVNANGGNYHLSAGSPCIDKGEAAAVVFSDLDIDGQARKAGNAPDIGADEFGSVAPLSLADIRKACAAAGGLAKLTADERERFNVVTTGSSQNRVDLLDAIRLLKTLAGG